MPIVRSHTAVDCVEQNTQFQPAPNCLEPGRTIDPSNLGTGEALDSKHRQLLQKEPTPIRIDWMWPLLSRYPDRNAARQLEEGFTDGFRTPVPPPSSPSFADNLCSVRGTKDEVHCKIGKDVSAGWVIGPFPMLPIHNLQVSPLGIVPKKTPGEYHLIHHLSYPEGQGVNHKIPPHLASIKYTSLDQPINMVKCCGPGPLMAKADIQSAFWLLLIHPADFCHLGFYFEGGYYTNKCMPMNLSVSCSHFECFSSFLEWAVQFKTGVAYTVHYLDDFLFSGPQDSAICAHLLRAFTDLCMELGVP